MDALCPKYDTEYEKVLASDEVQKEEKQNKVMYSMSMLFYFLIMNCSI